MPIHLASAAIEKVFAWETYPTLAACAVSAIVLKRWAAGVDLLFRLDNAATSKKSKLAPNDTFDDAPKKSKEKHNATIVPKKELRARDLHGTVVLIVGGFTSQGLLVCSQLSSLGAQLVLLTPSMESERTLQLVHLMRDGTSNPLIYAEECDVTNLASIEAFAAMWNLGEGRGSAAGGVGAGPAGGLSGSTGLGASARSGKQDGGSQDATAPRRIDAIVFLPLDETRHSIGDAPCLTAEKVELAHAEIMGRFHLVNLLLPSVLLLPPHRDVRIISLLSPWYAAGIADLKIDDLELSGRQGKRSRWPTRSPWRLDGAQTLLWLSLSRELQRRIQLMADADQRPRTKLPGIDDTGRPIGVTPTNVNIVNVCAGFERGRDVLDYLLPSLRLARHAGNATEESNSDDLADEAKPSTLEEKHAELRGLLNKSQGRKTKKSKGKANVAAKEAKGIDTMARELDTHVSSGLLPTLLRRIQQLFAIIIVILLWPLAWLFCKSPKRAAETVTWATIAPVVHISSEHGNSLEGAKRNVKLLEEAIDEAGGAPIVVPGELHREGKVVQTMMPAALQPQSDGPQKLWDAMEARARAIVAGGLVDETQTK